MEGRLYRNEKDGNRPEKVHHYKVRVWSKWLPDETWWNESSVVVWRQVSESSHYSTVCPVKFS